MIQKNQIIEGKNRNKGASKMTQKIGHQLCMIPYGPRNFTLLENRSLNFSKL